MNTSGVGSSSTEFGDDYIEIVNEINDFIASLTGSSGDSGVTRNSQSSGSPVEYPPVYPSVYPGDRNKPQYSQPCCPADDAVQCDVAKCPDIPAYDFVNHIGPESVDRHCVDRRTYLLEQPNYRRESDHSEYTSDRSDCVNTVPSDRSDCVNSLPSDRSDFQNSFTSDRSDCQNSFTSDRSDCQNSFTSDRSDCVNSFQTDQQGEENNSSEDDYEPIESLPPIPTVTPLVPPPLPPLRPKFRKMSDGPPKYVKALHTFKGSNNDELCFSKGDIITVTQVLDEGWWEGTLNGKTGWFPSNYVKEVKGDIGCKSNRGSDIISYKRESMQLYHNVVLKNIIETEKSHVEGMTKVLQTYIKPLQNAGVLSPTEYSQLVGNLEQIDSFQHTFLASLEECEKLPPMKRRIGGVFMQHAPQLKMLYMEYCANHPKAVAVLLCRREDLNRFMESAGASPPGYMTLTTNLSKPFTRLDKYPSLLKELERHIEESHPDRGDTQRAIAVYREIANSCLETRRLKEMEHEIITSTIKGWEGEDISALGDVVHLSQVQVHKQTGEKYDRIFVLFPGVLVMLSMSPRLSGYQYEGKLPLSGMTVNRCEDSETYPNGFEISGNMIEKMVVTCGTRIEVNPWVEILRQQISQSYHSTSSTPQSLKVSTSQPSISTLTQAKTAKVMHSQVVTSPVQNKVHKTWSMSCLRPSPPLRPSLMCRDEVLKSPRANRKSATAKRKPDDPKVYYEDAFILQVIEAYCNSAKTRHTVNSCRQIISERRNLKVDLSKMRLSDGSGSGSGSNSSAEAYTEPLISPDLDDYNFLRGHNMMQGFCCATFPLARGLARTMKPVLSSPHVLIADEEKIIDESDFQEKTLVDTVYSLKDKVKELEQEQKRMKRDIEDERKARRRLENMIHKQMGRQLLEPVSSETSA